MNAAKYIHSSTVPHTFFDSISNQQSKSFASTMMPIAKQSMPPSMPKRGSLFMANENIYYPNGNGAADPNAFHYYEHSQQGLGMASHTNSARQRFAPYPFYKRSHTNPAVQPANQRFYNYQSQHQPLVSSNIANISDPNSPVDTSFGSGNSQPTISGFNGNTSNGISPVGGSPFDTDAMQCVTLQISNLDTTYEERELKQYLINRLKPIATVISIYFESMSIAKIKVPSEYQARQVIAHLHRKKIGHKRITVSHTRESSTLDSSTLRCQVAGLLKDIPNYKVSMYKFRELFQSRFKTSISVVDLHEMKDICTIIGNKNEELIALRTELIDSFENLDCELMEYFQHSVPHCTEHFGKMHRGWAEQEIDPLPNVQMTIAQVRDVIFALLKNHQGVLKVASIMHCIQAELNVQLERNENGVNLEHLISCVPGVQITSNKFSIKILNWSNGTEMSPKDKDLIDDIPAGRYTKYGNMPDTFANISREIVELIKLSPKATLKFSRFIPAYHNHFGKQCRVADYGYTKLIDLFEALSSVVQVMGEGENRQLTLTHRVQVHRFKADLLRILRTQSTKSLMLSHMPIVYDQVQGRKFNITDYGVCDINDILNSLANTNVIVVNAIPHMMDTMISIPKRKQSPIEVDKTSNFAAEVVELFKPALHYTILFEKFACSYHYHFGYQCRLSDYGFLKLADLMEAITGVIEMEFSNDEDRKIFLSPKTAQRIFSEQIKDLVEEYTGASDTVTSLQEILVYHKKKYGYQIMPQTLGFHDMLDCIKSLPYVEVISSNGFLNVKCHHDNQVFRGMSYAAVHLLLENDREMLPLADFMNKFGEKYNEAISERLIKTMKHAVEIQNINDIKYIGITKQMGFILHMVKVIESQGTINLQDLSNTLKLSIKACFPFGYPNLTTFIQAFPDIFLLQLSKTNSALNEITVNNQCILSKHGFARFANYFNDIKNNNNNNNNSNSNNNNNNSDLSNLNYNNKITVLANGSCDGDAYDLAPLSNEKMFKGAATLSMHTSLPCASSSLCDSIGGQDMNYHHHSAFDISTSTKFAANDSYQSLNISVQNDLELDLNNNRSFNNDKCNDISGHSEDEKIGLENLMSTFRYRETNLNDTENVSILQRTLNGKEVNYNSRKRKLYGGPPKPDTPPAAPYWNNPIWSSNVNSPPVNIKIELPKLEVINSTLVLDSPMVMAKIAKKNQFLYTNQKK